MDNRIPAELARFWDDRDLPFNKDPNRPPNCLSILLRRLNVSNEPFSVKKKAVAEWLKENEPGWCLRDELEDEGYIDS